MKKKKKRICISQSQFIPCKLSFFKFQNNKMQGIVLDLSKVTNLHP